MHGPPVLLCGVLGKLGGDEPVQESELFNPGRTTCFLLFPRCSSILQNATNLNVQKLFASIIKGLKGVQR